MSWNSIHQSKPTNLLPSIFLILQSFPHFGLHLINLGNTVPLGEKFRGPVVDTILRHPCHGHVDPLREFEIKFAVSDVGILFVELVEFALFEKDDGIELEAGRQRARSDTG